MRLTWRRLGGRVTLALGLTALVLAAVGVAKLAGRDVTASRYQPANRPVPTIDPTEGDDAEVVAMPTDFPDRSVVLAVATRFIAVWLRQDLSTPEWHAGVAAFATPSLTQRLAGVEPVTVPARRIVAEPTLALHADGYAQVVIAVDTGSLRLGLVHRDGRWLVDTLDWDRA